MPAAAFSSCSTLPAACTSSTYRTAAIISASRFNRLLPAGCFEPVRYWGTCDVTDNLEETNACEKVEPKAYRRKKGQSEEIDHGQKIYDEKVYRQKNRR